MLPRSEQKEYEEKRPAHTADAALALIRAHRALVKTILSDFDGAKADDINNVNWVFLLRQLADPANVRPVHDLTQKLPGLRIDRSRIYDASTGDWVQRFVEAKRGQPKQTIYTKKTATSLLPKHARMTLCHASSNTVGILFDINQCYLKEKYIFKADAYTNHRWWLLWGHKQKFITEYLAKASEHSSLADLRASQDRIEKAGQAISEHNEILARLSKESVYAIFATVNYVVPRVNAIHKKILTDAFLKTDLPLLVITDSGAKEYTLDEQFNDFLTCYKRDASTPGYQLAMKIFMTVPLNSLLGNKMVARRSELPQHLLPAPILTVGFNLADKKYDIAAKQLETLEKLENLYKLAPESVLAAETWLAEQKISEAEILRSPLADIFFRSGKRYKDPLVLLLKENNLEKLARAAENLPTDHLYKLEKHFYDAKIDNYFYGGDTGYQAVLASPLGHLFLQKGRSILAYALENDAKNAEEYLKKYGFEEKTAKEQISNAVLALLKLKSWDLAGRLAHRYSQECLFPDTRAVEILLQEKKIEEKLLESISLQSVLREKMPSGKIILDMAIEKDWLTAITVWINCHAQFSPAQCEIMLRGLLFHFKRADLAKTFLRKRPAIQLMSVADKSKSVLECILEDKELASDLDLVRLVCDTQPFEKDISLDLLKRLNNYPDVFKWIMSRYARKVVIKEDYAALGISSLLMMVLENGGLELTPATLSNICNQFFSEWKYEFASLAINRFPILKNTCIAIHGTALPLHLVATYNDSLSEGVNAIAAERKDIPCIAAVHLFDQCISADNLKRKDGRGRTTLDILLDRKMYSVIEYAVKKHFRLFPNNQLALLLTHLQKNGLSDQPLAKFILSKKPALRTSLHALFKEAPAAGAEQKEAGPPQQAPVNLSPWQ